MHAEDSLRPMCSDSASTHRRGSTWSEIGRRWLQFLQRIRIACSARAILSVRPSVCPTRSGVLSRRMKIRSCDFHKDFYMYLIPVCMVPVSTAPDFFFEFNFEICALRYISHMPSRFNLCIYEVRHKNWTVFIIWCRKIICIANYSMLYLK